MAAAGRRSALPDDLHLDSRPYAAKKHGGRYRPWTIHTFFRDAKATLRRHRGGTGLKRLTLFLDTGAVRDAKPYWEDDDDKQVDDERVAAILADPAAEGLEELCVDCESDNRKTYRPPLSLPCASTLRVLEFAYCNLGPPSAGLGFPRLTDLRLRCCDIPEGYLQVVVDASPALTNLTLVSVSHKSAEKADRATRVRFCLRCPTVTALVLEINACKEDLESCSASSGIHLDIPSLHFFRYQGFPVKLSLKSPAPGLTQVDLDAARRDFHIRQYEPTSRMLRSFSSTRVLKLRLHCIEDIVAGEEEHGGVILPTFPNLELLELEGHYQYKNDDTAVAMARLLRSCPVMSELRLVLNMKWDYRYRESTKDPVGGPFSQSMDRFNRLASMASTQRDIAGFREISELTALSNNCMFSCLRTSLRKVTLQFEAKELNCFQVQLAKFLVENAVHLEEMHIDDGSQLWPDHLNHKVAKWRADSFRRRNVPDTGDFQIYTS